MREEAAVPALNPFPSDALDANRRGELSEDQRRNFTAWSRYRRKNSLSIAGFFVAGALLMAFFASPTSSALLRAFVAFICLAIAAFLVTRAMTGSDALTRDLRHAQVESVEGAIGKRSVGSGRGASTHFLDVGERSFKVAPATYAAAPDAGRVRVYFLPRSGKIVNLERLPNAPLPGEVTPDGIAESLGAALRSHSRRQMNEARAELASIADALNATFTQSPTDPAPAERDRRPLREAIVGTWSNALMHVTFSADGTLTTRTFGTKKNAHWSVDGSGRLHADITGRAETADAWVVGNHLTISADGTGMTFTRDPGA